MMNAGFYVGSSLTIADLAMYRLVGWISGGVLDGLPTDLVDSYPQIKANVEATKSNEKVKAYLAEKYPGK